jgi:hypothetical protein
MATIAPRDPRKEKRVAEGTGEDLILTFRLFVGEFPIGRQSDGGKFCPFRLQPFGFLGTLTVHTFLKGRGGAHRQNTIPVLLDCQVANTMIAVVRKREGADAGSATCQVG